MQSDRHPRRELQVCPLRGPPPAALRHENRSGRIHQPRRSRELQVGRARLRAKADLVAARPRRPNADPHDGDRQGHDRTHGAAAMSDITFPNLDAAIAHHVDKLGFRLDMIMPADAPRTAIVSRNGEALRLVATERGVQIEPAGAPPPLVMPEGDQRFLITRAATATAWGAGRAGMQYRDLIPGRLGGRYIASHIRITDGGPVDDYVHHH